MFWKKSKSDKKRNDNNPEELNITEAIRINEKLKSFSSGYTLTPEDEESLATASKLIENFLYIYHMWIRSKKKINKLLKMMFGNKCEANKDKGNEKEKDQNTNQNSSPKDDNKQQSKDDPKAKPRNGGGGKNGADAYEGAAEIICKLDENTKPGNKCPECNKGTLYEINPKKVIRLVGNAPITAFKFILQQVRCICGFQATADVGDEYREIYNADKYGPTALAAMIIYKYIMGVSFGTLAMVQNMAGTPLPASTQANQIKNKALPVFKAILSIMFKMAANGMLFGFDDTIIRIIKKRVTKKGEMSSQGYGTAVVINQFDEDENEIIIFDLNPTKHAGDVICDLLAERENDNIPLLISDGLKAYDESKKLGIDINCNIHARRKVYEEDPNKKTYLGEAVLDSYSDIYTNDKFCKNNNLSPIERMKYHQENSSIHFEKINIIFKIIVGKKVGLLDRQKHKIPDYLNADEPNSDIYNIANYFLKRYKSLTQVLTIPGVPLDTNYVERMIKTIIRLRKNSLFFNNVASSEYSGEILSVLETAVQNGVNVFDYTDYILSNAETVLKNPQNYLPWNYKLNDLEKENYWNRVDHFIANPSNFEESPNSENYHSSG